MSKIKLKYIGRRMTSKGKLEYKYLNIDDEKEHWRFAKKISYESIGCIVEATKTDSGVKSPYKVTTDDSVDITLYVEKDKLAYIESNARKEIKKVHPTKYNETVLFLNNVLFDLSPTQRKLFKYKLLMDLKY